MNLTPGSANVNSGQAGRVSRTGARAVAIPVTGVRRRSGDAGLQSPEADGRAGRVVSAGVGRGRRAGRPLLPSSASIHRPQSRCAAGRWRQAGEPWAGNNPHADTPSPRLLSRLADGRDILHELKDELARYKAADLPGCHALPGAVGYLGYDVVRFFEKLPERLPRRQGRG